MDRNEKLGEKGNGFFLVLEIPDLQIKIIV